MSRDEAIKQALSNHKWWTLKELSLWIDYPEASISAGIRTLRRVEGLPIIKRRVETGDKHLLFEYRLEEPSRISE